MSLRSSDSSVSASSPALPKSGPSTLRTRPLGTAMVRGRTVIERTPAGMLARSLDAHHVGAEALELPFDVLVAAIQVVNAPDLGFLFGSDQARNDERCAGAQVGGHHA